MINWITLPGSTNYIDCLELMQIYVNKVLTKCIKNTIILTEHSEVYTTGISSEEKQELINKVNIPIVNSNRGGKITYHGPGQRIIYPIIDLSKSKDIKKYVNQLECWIIATLRRFDIFAFSIKNNRGLWVDTNTKIASIGIRVKNWITFHGCAVNINTDLSKFKNIIPCGINNCVMTSCYNLGKNITFDQFDYVLKEEYSFFFLIQFIIYLFRP